MCISLVNETYVSFWGNEWVMFCWNMKSSNFSSNGSQSILFETEMKYETCFASFPKCIVQWHSYISSSSFFSDHNADKILLMVKPNFKSFWFQGVSPFSFPFLYMYFSFFNHIKDCIYQHLWHYSMWYLLDLFLLFSE